MRPFFITVYLGCWVFLFWPGPALSESLRLSEKPSTLDFIYVNANVGEAAGGHTALRLGDTVFHYQFYQNGNFLLVRETWERFRFIYNELCNRSISMSCLPLNPATCEKLRCHFINTILEQKQTFKRLDEGERQLKFIERLLLGQRILCVPSLGLFDRSRSEDPQAVSLRHDLDKALGESFLVCEEERVGVKIESLAISIDKPQSLERFIEETTLHEALRVLLDGRPVAEAALILPLKNEECLTPAERSSLELNKKRLEKSIIGLLRSRRLDRGAALLRQIARYLTVRRSLMANRLLSLDPFSVRALSEPVSEDKISSTMLHSLHRQLQGEVAARRHNFFNETAYPEIAYSLLESSRGRLYEMEQVTGRGVRFMRVESGPLVPSRQAEISLAELFFITAQLEIAAQALKSQVQVQQELIKKEYSYNLVEHNCATELVYSLSAAFADPVVERQLLGGRLESQADLAFVPFIFYRQARTIFGLDIQDFLPSRRLRKLQALSDKENVLKIWFREANTISSTIYEIRSEDTPFLFFTDDAKLLRPLEGAVNFCYAALHGTVGLLTLPFDGGERLHQSMRGMFYSLPEIFFWNIRKGTYGRAALSSATAAP